ncbi:lantibiotic dehydratase [Kitasatospora aureofaciens]|uniref:lantibiotic dehydratase n=1 Tax=Kitasatospora aureofaciens TaxID=1894 RepID=UPI001C4466C2|nr:lantibiotic dehydratase [Kitasatospora aureofaciens]MBV6699401.1 lantibiotic dehydratase [Kitasatospora aureofaciens]
MRPTAPPAFYRAAGVALVRAVARPGLPVPAWPDLTTNDPVLVPQWLAWLRAVRAEADCAEALALASPALARRVEELAAAAHPAPREVRRAVMATARYVLRAGGRATPFALFSGVQAAVFGPFAGVRWGDDHHAVARLSAAQLAAAIEQFERHPGLLARLDVTANDTVHVRGDRLVIPHQPLNRPERRAKAAEVTLRHTLPVAFALAAARHPIPFRALAGKLSAEFPTAPAERITDALTELVARRALITGLHAPATEPDALGHLLAALERAGADQVPNTAALFANLRTAHATLAAHNQAPGRATRAQAEASLTTADHRDGAARPPLAVDLRLDADLVLPEAVADEAARAAGLLTRLSPFPYGTAAWRAYHQRFYERYGRGALVPLLDMVADSGIGWPDGYPGARPAEPPRFDERDQVLAALAQRAALDGEREVVLDDALLAALDLGPEQPRLPPHLEIGFHLHARSQQALDRGEFRLAVVSASRAAGVSVGRFLHLLDPEYRERLTTVLTGLPTMDEHAVTAQLSYPPLDAATAHVARSIPTGQLVVSLAEHRPPTDRVLRPQDLAVGCDGRRMYLAAPALGVRIEAAPTHALNLRVHTPPLARLITELSRAQGAQVTRFGWGSLGSLPFRPRLRHGRVILSPATWRLTATELPGPHEPWEHWDKALTAWLARRRPPRHVMLAADSQGLPLDLDHPGHRVLLRTHLDAAPHAVLVEAPDHSALGWAGGRAHEIVVPLTATRAPAWPRLPQPTTARLLRRGHGDAPGTSRVLLAALYGDLERQDTVLTTYLPDLLERLGHPAWWFVRFRDPRQHLRLRIALPDPAAFGPTAATVSAWTAELHRAGLLSELAYPTSYTETGRWGEGPAWAAAEQVFHTDSTAVLAQLSQPVRPGRLALLAAHAVAVTAGFTGSPAAGLRWLIDNVPAKAPAAIPRPAFREAVHLADPADDWATLRAEPGGPAIVDAWTDRRQALDAYRQFFPGPHTRGVAPSDVLGSLLHCNYVRAHRIDFDDEAQILYLARAAALARLSRDGDL